MCHVVCSTRTYVYVLPEQKVIKYDEIKYDEMIDVKFRSAVDPQMIKNDASKQFSTCNFNIEILGKVISIF